MFSATSLHTQRAVSIENPLPDTSEVLLPVAWHFTLVFLGLLVADGLADTHAAVAVYRQASPVQPLGTVTLRLHLLPFLCGNINIRYHTGPVSRMYTPDIKVKNLNRTACLVFRKQSLPFVLTASAAMVKATRSKIVTENTPLIL